MIMAVLGPGDHGRGVLKRNKIVECPGKFGCALGSPNEFWTCHDVKEWLVIRAKMNKICVICEAYSEKSYGVV